MSDTSKSAAFWRSFPIFEEFDTETIAAIADIATHRKWPAGTVIFQRGDEGNYMLAIASGRVTAQGTPDELRTLTGEANLEDAFVKLIGSEEGLHA